MAAKEDYQLGWWISKKRLPIRRSLLALVSLVIGLIALSVAWGAQPASAAPYDGTSPTATGCAKGARTVDSANITEGSRVLGVVRLRYSDQCETIWAQLTINAYEIHCYPGDDGCGSVRVIRNSDRASFYCDTEDGTDPQICWTKQLNDSGVTSYARGLIQSGPSNYYAHTGSY